MTTVRIELDDEAIGKLAQDFGVPAARVQTVLINRSLKFEKVT